MFEVARDEWGVPFKENPLDKLQLRAPDQQRERRLKPGELDKLLECARHCRNPLIAPIIQFAFETGMRRGEILSITRDDVDCESRALLVPQTKNGQTRTIPLTRPALAVLLQRLGEGHERLFPITANAFRLAWQRLKRSAGIGDLRFHDLRHEAISRFFEKGLSVPEVACISGHKDARMLFRYSHAIRERVLEKLDSEN